MKFIVSGSEISNATSKVSKALGSKTTNPILEGIKLSVKGDELTLTATDIDITIEKTINVTTFTEGEALIPGKIFSEFVKKLENEDEIVISLEDNELKIGYGISDLSIQVMDIEDYPIINKQIKEKFFTMKQGEFKNIVLNTIFACSQNQHNSRRVDGCYISIEDNTISAVATDTGRMAINNKPIESSSGNFSILVTPRTLNEMVRILDKDDDIFTVIIQKNVIMCEIDGTILISTLIEGTYVDYKNLLVGESNTEIKVNRLAFLSALERAAIVATDFNKTVKFEVVENKLTVYAKSEIGKIAENVNVDMEGKDIEIAFFLKYIVEAVKAINDDFIKLCFDSSIRPCIIKPISGNDYMHLIIPIRKYI